MSDLFFFVKLLVLTVVLVIFMQVQVGNGSLESHAMNWVQTSSIAAPLNTVAQGGAQMIRDVSSSIYSSILHNTGKKKKEDAHKASSFHWFHRSTSEPEQSSGANN